MLKIIHHRHFAFGASRLHNFEPTLRRFSSGTVALLPSTSDSAAKAKTNCLLDIEALLAEPSWSVSSLLPPKDQADTPPPISSKQLHHLLRLSALPPPASAEEEKEMMKTLSAQLHFVKEMQKVDTTGIRPLSAIRDETKEAEQEQEITLESLKYAFEKEEVVGKHYKRIRRQPDKTPKVREPQNWDPLSHAQRTSGRFFVVDSGSDDKV